MPIPGSSTALLCTVAAVIGLSTATCHAQGAREGRVDIGGFNLFTSESGSGTPAVIFESGLGEDISTWEKVQPQIAPLTRTFMYDRAGLDKSDPSPNPKTVEAMVSELHSLLQAAKVPPPYLLVGHSLGGALIQLFAHNYPAEVAGLVLVDPEDGRLLDRLHAHLPKSEWDARQRMLDQALPNFSPAQRAELEGTKSSGKALAAALPLPDVPVVLLTGTLKDPGFPGNPFEQDLKLELQNELLVQLPHSKHVLVPNSRHYIQDDAPDLVIDAIREVLAQSRAAVHAHALDSNER